MPEPRYYRNEVMAALNRAANVIADSHSYESEETIRDDSIADLIVSLAAHWLDHPDDSLEKAVAAQYETVEPDKYDLDDGEAMPVKGSDRWNELVARTVLGWTR